MKLELLEDTGIVYPLEILDGFTVMVRHRTRKQIQALGKMTSRKRPGPGGVLMEVIDDELWIQHAPPEYVDGWTGLTNSIIRRLGVPLKTELPETVEEVIEGVARKCIPFDLELLRDIWRHALPDKFGDPIVRFARDLLDHDEQNRLQKKAPLSASS